MMTMMTSIDLKRCHWLTQTVGRMREEKKNSTWMTWKRANQTRPHDGTFAAASTRTMIGATATSVRREIARRLPTRAAPSEPEHRLDQDRLLTDVTGSGCGVDSDRGRRDPVQKAVQRVQPEPRRIWERTANEWLQRWMKSERGQAGWHWKKRVMKVGETWTASKKPLAEVGWRLTSVNVHR